MTWTISVKQKILFSLWAITLLVLILAGVLASGWFSFDQSGRLDEFLARETRVVQDLMDGYFEINGSESIVDDSFENPEFRSYAQRYFQQRADRPLPYKTTAALVDSQGREILVSNAALDLGQVSVRPSRDTQTVTVNGPPEYRLTVAPIEHNGRVLGTVRMACLTAALGQAWTSFFSSLVLVLGTVFVSFGLLGTVLVHWSLSPVRRMSLSAAAISDSRLERRLEVPSGQDEIAELARTLNNLLQRLQNDFEFEEALLGQLSHELRTPLTILRARNEVALERAPEQSLRHVLEDNMADIDNVVSLLNTLLNLARLDGRKDLVARQSCDLRQILQDLIEELDPLWLEKDLSFHLVLPPGTGSWAKAPPLPVIGDAVLLRQAFLNILTNAFKYTPRGSRIHLSIEARGDDKSPEWSLVFRNPGPAIPEEALDLVFKRFYRVEVQDPEHYERLSGLPQPGFGLGLSITKTMIDLHNGQVRAFNPPSGGAAFEVRLPRAPTF